VNRRLPTAALFLVGGAVAASLVRAPEGFAPAAEVTVHFRLWAALAALFATGTWLDGRLGLGGGERAPFHRILLGQSALLVWFLVRSATVAWLHFPGVSGVELWLLAAAAAFAARRELGQTLTLRESGAAIPWLAWWISLFAFVALRSGALATLSSDPDLHAWLGKLAAERGAVLHLAGYPYPSGYSDLNAIWLLLSGATPVQAVNCGVAVQSCLAVGLLLDLMVLARRKAPLVSGLVLIAVAHYVFAFPVDARFPCFEKTGQLAFKAFALFPFTWAARVVLSEPRRRRRFLLGAVGFAFAGGWALTTNPACALVALPLLAVLAPLFLFGAAGEPRAGAWRDRVLVALAVVVPLLVIVSDDWLYANYLRGATAGSTAASSSEPPTTAAKSPALGAGRLLAAGLRQAVGESTLGLFAPGCSTSSQCPAAIEPAVTALPVVLGLLAIGWLAWAVRRRRLDARALLALLIVAIVATSWLLRVEVGATPALSDTDVHSLLHEYVGLASVGLEALLFAALVATGLAFAGRILDEAPLPEKWRGGRELAAAAGLAALVFGLATVIAPERTDAIAAGYRANVVGAPRSNLGPIEPADIEIARAAEKLVPRDESVLLLGWTWHKNQFEHWLFPYAGARAFPLYSDTPFADFHNHGVLLAADYEAHVCARFDLPWLAAHGVRWIFFSEGSFYGAGRRCPHAWLSVRDDYFEEKLRFGDRALFRLRDDKLAAAASDARLGLP
jgi:hypothetical protein